MERAFSTLNGFNLMRGIGHSYYILYIIIIRVPFVNVTTYLGNVF